MNKWLTPKDVSELLQVSRSTAYNIIDKMEKDGATVWRPTKRITRVNPRDLEKYLEKK